MMTRPMPKRACEHGNIYCEWPTNKGLVTIEAAERAGKRTGFQNTHEISPWRVHFTGLTNSQLLLCNNHSSYLDEYFGDEITFEDMIDSLRSDIYLRDRTIL